jgi:hypothetical protein
VATNLLGQNLLGHARMSVLELGSALVVAKRTLPGHRDSIVLETDAVPFRDSFGSLDQVYLGIAERPPAPFESAESVDRRQTTQQHFQSQYPPSTSNLWTLRVAGRRHND